MLIAVLAESLDAVFIMYGAERFGFTEKGLLVSVMGSLAGALALTPAFMGMGAIAGILIGGLTAKVFMEYWAKGLDLRRGPVIGKYWEPLQAIYSKVRAES